MSPAQYLFIILFLTAVAAIVQALAVHYRRKRLRRLAKEWQMQFAAGDRLQLADRIAAKIPGPGASNVCVYDLLFDSDGARHRYVFTVSYGLGVVRGKRRRFCVAGFNEPVSRTGAPAADCQLTLAPIEMPFTKAYEHVRELLK
jgi:hypothetical protein